VIAEDFKLAKEVYKALEIPHRVDSFEGKREHYAITAKYRDFRHYGLNGASLADVHSAAVDAARTFANPGSPVYALRAAAWEMWASYRIANSKRQTVDHSRQEISWT